MAFCQVVLKKSLVDMVEHNPWGYDWWDAAYEEHKRQNVGPYPDPLPFVSSLAGLGSFELTQLTAYTLLSPALIQNPRFVICGHFMVSCLTSVSRSLRP